MRKIFLIFVFFTTITLHAFSKGEYSKPTVCLNMIVKDEAPVIERCLASVRTLIDYWVIVDTGSTDGTQEIIKRYMQGIPGELYERPWVNFAHNRNEALELARSKSDYSLIIDADERLIFAEDFTMPILTKDNYSIPIKDADGSTFQRIHFVNNKLDWHWYGVLHEGIACSEAKTHEVLKKVQNLAVTGDGHRSQDPKKHQKDALTLENALKIEPNNSRYVFYLAQTYLNCKEYEDSIKTYEKRAIMGGAEEEVFYSLYMVGKLKQFLAKPFDEITNSYTACFISRPTRAEPLYRLACLFIDRKEYIQAYAILKLAVDIPLPDDLLFVEESVYEYEAPFQLANCAAYIGKHEEAMKIYERLVSLETLPSQIQNNIKVNLKIIEEKVRKINVNKLSK
jgi:glycosyltransferase involved in cell wall biosynthesis